MCMTLTTQKHFCVLFLTRQRQKKFLFFFLWEKELYSTRIMSTCCSAFQEMRKLSGCLLLTKTLSAFVYYLSITPLLFIIYLSPLCWGIGSVGRWSDCPLWRAVECHKNWRVPIILFLLRQQRWLQSASSPAILKKKNSKKFVPCIPPAVSFETHRRTSEQRAGRTRTKRLSLLTASQTSEDSVLVKDWLIDSDIFAVCQFPPVWNMNVGTSFPGSLMQCVRLSIKCVCAPVTSHAIAFVY